MTEITRRTALGLLGAVAVPSTGVVAAVPAFTPPTIEDILAKATPAERARYHATAMMEVMGEMHPDRLWRSHIDHKHGFVMIIGDKKEDRS